LLLRPGERDAGHIVRLLDRAVRELRVAGHHVRHLTGDLVRPGHVGVARIAHVSLAVRPKEGSGRRVGYVAWQGLRYHRRVGGAAKGARGEEAQQQVEGSVKIKGHVASGIHRLGSAWVPVMFGHQRGNILRRVHIPVRKLHHIPESQLHRHRNPPSEYIQTAIFVFLSLNFTMKRSVLY